MVRHTRRLAAALLCGALSAAPSAALAQEVAGEEQPVAEQVSVRSVDVSRFPLVSLTVSTSASTSFAPGDVALVENGVPVRLSSIEALGSSGAEVDAVLAIDVSNSMSGLELETALAAARTFLQGVPADMPIGVVSFADSVVVRSPVTDDLKSALLGT